MKLFMFTAIIFTMASTTVTARTCRNNMEVCAIQYDEMYDYCSCSNGGCIKDDPYKVAVPGMSVFTCQQISDFNICGQSQFVMKDPAYQINCRCRDGRYKVVHGGIKCE
uniref:Conotoxin-like unassigned superfamily 08 n=1 Tax=Conus ermineus TaxID=55423 RepID=A0A346CJ21_CONER|nr:conotoxin-like precursor unassigned superfamily 08 [Conus ermineus]